MIGRFSQADVYRELVRSRDFARVAAAGALALGSWLLDRGGGPGGAGTALALGSVALNGVPIVWGAVRGVLRRQVNVDELVAIAIVASLLQGEVLTAAAVSFVMVLGALIEEATSDSARKAVSALVGLAPQTAVVVAEGGERRVPVEGVEVGQRVRVRPGERIPVDGVIRAGLTAVDESSVTGEPLAVEKGPGATVYAGTLNQSGAVEIEATRVGRDTTLGKVIRLVAEAERHKPEAVRTIDRYARWFTPAILACAGAAWAVTGDPSRAITVLIVGCPCALILAAPTAIVASIGRAARAGILVKGGTYLEEVGRATAVWFDKTGTLTEGRPRVVEIAPVAEAPPETVLELAAAVERHSTHPLAAAILQAARDRGLSPPEACDGATEAGVGVRARVDGRRVEVVRPEALSGDRSAVAGPVARLRDRGATAAVVLCDGRPLGVIGIADRVRPGAPRAVRALRALGVAQVGILSGDHERPAALAARFVGATHVRAGLTPEEKLAALREAQRTEPCVVFVGDGINDAPALAAAHVGIAMAAAGTDVALETADVALMNDDLLKLPFLVDLSRRMRRRIRWNIAVGLGFNAFAVVAGGAGLFSPVVGAVVHNLGSVLVVASSASLAFVPERLAGHLAASEGSRPEPGEAPEGAPEEPPGWRAPPAEAAEYAQRR
ncbi:MAG: heavy metal translocating P-type ATPase [Deferrisomatales bacterium]